MYVDKVAIGGLLIALLYVAVSALFDASIRIAAMLAQTPEEKDKLVKQSSRYVAFSYVYFIVVYGVLVVLILWRQ